MSRNPLGKSWGLALLGALALPALAAAQAGVSPHVDTTVSPAGCRSCHEGHGMSRSPMMPAPQTDVCFRCHGSGASRNQEILAQRLAPGADPQVISDVFNQPYTHPLSRTAFSRREGEVTCTSCHSPHRAMPQDESTALTLQGGRKPSPRDPNELEFELCQSCHGSRGTNTLSLSDISRLFDLSNRSYHPVQGPARERVPSVPQELSGREINCTDCHGNDNPEGPRGPHGSGVPFLLRRAYSTTDGSDSISAYVLCFNCHTAGRIFDENGRFPLHKMHVLDEQASCATCHSGHGSINNRSLIRFGEEAVIAGVSPAPGGVLSFESDVPGSGRCTLTCHGVVHEGEGYGLNADPDELLRRLLPSP